MIESELIRQTLAITFVFGLLGAAVWLLGKGRNRIRLLPGYRTKGDGHIQVVERVGITPQHTLFLLRVGSQGLLIAAHTTGCSVLASKPIARLIERVDAP